MSEDNRVVRRWDHVQENDIALVYPHLLAQFAADMGKAKRAVKALCLQSAVAQHLDYLCVLLTVFLEHEFSLLIVVLVLSFRQLVSLVCSKVERMTGSSPLLRFLPPFPLFFGIFGV